MQLVNIRKEEDKIKVSFVYNPDLISIMHNHHGYWFANEKVWIFPASKLDEVYDDLIKRNYEVGVIKEKNQQINKQKESSVGQQQKLPLKYNEEDVWKDESVFMVEGRCKKCGEYGFVHRNGLCGRCF